MVQKKNFNAFLFKSLSFNILNKPIIASVATNYNHFAKKKL